jgi:hypothetical protein
VPQWDRHTKTSLRVLKGPNYQLEAFYQFQLKPRIQPSGKPLQEIAAVIEQFAPQALLRSPEDFIQRKAVHVFVDGMLGQEVKQHLVMGHKRFINVALKQVLK